MRDLSSDRGFSLLEVVVSIALLSVAVAALFPSFSRALSRSSWAHERAAALDLAKHQIRSFEIDPDFSSLPSSGSSDAGYWEITLITPELEVDGYYKNDFGEAEVIRVVVTMPKSNGTVELEKTIWIDN